MRSRTWRSALTLWLGALLTLASCSSSTDGPDPSDAGQADGQVEAGDDAEQDSGDDAADADSGEQDSARDGGGGDVDEQDGDRVDAPDVDDLGEDLADVSADTVDGSDDVTEGDVGDSGDSGGSDGDSGGSDGDASDAGSLLDDLIAVNFDGLHLNELSILPTERGVANTGVPPMQWVELFWGGPDATALDGVRLVHLRDDGTVRTLATLPDVSAPAHTHLTVYFVPYVDALDLNNDNHILDELALADDIDLSDRQGHIYTDIGGILSTDIGGILSTDIGGILSTEHDDVALLDGDGSVVAFVAYGDNGGSDDSDLQNDAVAAGAWIAGGRVSLSGLSAGETFGLFSDGFHLASALRPGLIGGLVAGFASAAGDYRTFDWEIYQTTSYQQPANPLQIGPPDGVFVSFEGETLNWQGCPDVSGFLVEGYDAPSPSANLVFREITDEPAFELPVSAELPANLYWRVACLYIDDRLLMPFSPFWRVGNLDALSLAGSPTDLPVRHLVQRKDSPMLCLLDAAGGQGPGCPEELTLPEAVDVCRWNAPHPFIPELGVSACGPIGESYVARAAIQMVHDYFDVEENGEPPNLRPRLSQDMISYVAFRDVDPPGVVRADAPEGDLGVGLGMSVDQTRQALSDVLGVTPGDVEVDESPELADIAGWIDGGRPVILYRWWANGGGHISVAYGARPTGGAILVHDSARSEASGVPYAFDTFLRGTRGEQPLTAIVAPAEIGDPLVDPASLWIDDDSDGLSDFDEDAGALAGRLCSRLDIEDTDDDLIDDYAEVASYIFGTDGRGRVECTGIPGLPEHCVDLDLDSDRAECDCDSDGDNDNDGAERIGSLTGGLDADTDPFDPFDSDFDFQLPESVFELGSNVVVAGGTVHADTAFGLLVDELGLVPAGATFATDDDLVSSGVGDLDATIHECHSPGLFEAFVDVRPNGLVDSCDLALQFECCGHSDTPCCSVSSGLTCATGTCAGDVCLPNVRYMIAVEPNSLQSTLVDLTGDAMIREDAALFGLGDAALSTDGNFIVFTKDVGGQSEIYIMGPDGADPQLVSNYAVDLDGGGSDVFSNNAEDRFPIGNVSTDGIRWLSYPNGSDVAMLMKSPSGGLPMTNPDAIYPIAHAVSGDGNVTVLAYRSCEDTATFGVCSPGSEQHVQQLDADYDSPLYTGENLFGLSVAADGMGVAVIDQDSSGFKLVGSAVGNLTTLVTAAEGAAIGSAQAGRHRVYYIHTAGGVAGAQTVRSVSYDGADHRVHYESESTLSQALSSDGLMLVILEQNGATDTDVFVLGVDAGFPKYVDTVDRSDQGNAVSVQ